MPSPSPRRPGPPWPGAPVRRRRPRADTDLADAELRALRRHQQVARTRDLQYTGARKTLDRGDERTARAVDDEVAESSGRAVGQERLEIHARAEPAPGSREHADTESVVGVEAFDGLDESDGECGVD